MCIRDRYHHEPKKMSLQERSNEIRNSHQKTVNHSVETNAHLKTIKEHSAKTEQILKEQLLVQKKQLEYLQAIHHHVTNNKNKFKDELKAVNSVFGNDQNQVKPEINLNKGGNGNNFRSIF